MSESWAGRLTSDASKGIRRVPIEFSVHAVHPLELRASASAELERLSQAVSPPVAYTDVKQISNATQVVNGPFEWGARFSAVLRELP